MAGEIPLPVIVIHRADGLPRGVRLRVGEGDRRLGDTILDGRVVVEASTRATGPDAEASSWLQHGVAPVQATRTPFQNATRPLICAAAALGSG